MRTTMIGLFGLAVGLTGAVRGASENRADRDYVVLVHGLGRSSLSMARIARRLAAEDYRVINVSYPSTRLTIEAAAERAIGWTLNERIDDRSARIHFVTHSLGGILLRQYLTNHTVENLGRVVMLAPPNRGSELVDKLRNNFLYRLATGPSGQQLGTDEHSIPSGLGPVNFELGIIAGSRSLNPLFSRWIPGADDGKVSVQSTRVDGMRDFIEVPYSHTWMAWRKMVVESVANFLRAGRFLTDAAATALPPDQCPAVCDATPRR